MKKLSILFALVLTLCLALTMAFPVSAAYMEIPLVAGQNMTIGYISVQNVGSNLNVVFHVTASGWQLVDTHLAVYANAADFPVNGGGNPKVGQFPYHKADGNYTIPTPSGNPLYIGAHAVVNSTTYGGQTAWGMGTTCQGNPSMSFGGNNWAQYFIFYK